MMDYAYNHALFTDDMKVYSDSKVSDFLKDVTVDQRIQFLNEWNAKRDHREKIYISYDSTNKKSQAGEIDMVDLGHTKEGIEEDIFNYAVAYDRNNREPLFYESYPGRPIYLARRDRICAHLLIVFIALLFYRILESKLPNHYTDQQIIECLREMDIAKYPNEDSYLPAYTRTDLTDDIHQYLGFFTDYERMTDWRMRGNCRITKGTSKRKKN